MTWERDGSNFERSEVPEKKLFKNGDFFTVFLSCFFARKRKKKRKEQQNCIKKKKNFNFFVLHNGFGGNLELKDTSNFTTIFLFTFQEF